ncbi:hypothetical protein ABKV19_000476 [Rosa sericea]
MRYLKFIRVGGCDGLTRIPDLSGLTSLEHLEVVSCADLVEVHPSVGRLDKLVTLNLGRCRKLPMFQERINMKSLQTLVLANCPNLKFFPEIEGDMKSLNRLDLSWNRAIKELPCSVGNLTGLKSLSLFYCDNLTDIPSSIFYGLQHLEELNLESCSNLVTFPTKSESLPPPVSSTNLTSRLQVRLNYCTRLEAISEFPREIHVLSLKGCRSLQRISKLSKILEGKDSKMFGELYLPDSDTLCDNLARGVVSEVEVDKRLLHLAKKRKKMTSSPEELMEEADKLTALLSLFFSCAKSEEFQVEFPARVPIPNWFTCRQDVNWDVNGKVINKEHEFCIEIPQNSNWDNKGLALCIQSCRSLYSTVYINGIKFDVNYGGASVHYIPFVTVIRRLIECGMPPPDMFRVMFRSKQKAGGGVKKHLEGSFGVHLIEDLEGESR